MDAEDEVAKLKLEVEQIKSVPLLCRLNFHLNVRWGEPYIGKRLIRAIPTINEHRLYQPGRCLGCGLVKTRDCGSVKLEGYNGDVVHSDHIDI